MLLAREGLELVVQVEVFEVFGEAQESYQQLWPSHSHADHPQHGPGTVPFWYRHPVRSRLLLEQWSVGANQVQRFLHCLPEQAVETIHLRSAKRSTSQFERHKRDIIKST